MSLPMEVKKRCFMCGEESRQTVLLSTNAFGPSDLDYRPPEMQRSTMYSWSQECPHCGYVAASLERPTTLNKGFLESQEYLTCAGRNLASPLAERFYRQYLIARQEEKWEDAFYAILYAAWECDDWQDAENAVACRKLALKAMEQIPDRSQPDRMVQRADLLRRVGMFDVVVSTYHPEDYEDETLQKIVRFQIQKATEQDTGCYTIEDASA